MRENKKTIFALSSGAGPSGLSVIRLSGPLASCILCRMLKVKIVPIPRKAIYGHIYHPKTGEHLDNAIVIYFKGPASFTGQDIVELHLHGGRSIITEVLDALSEENGLYLAEPGEYSKIAFENGKIDLTSAEGLADLIHAETKMQRRQALRQMSGELERIYESWREKLIKALAYIEATIDFPDEELPNNIINIIHNILNSLFNEIDHYLLDQNQGEHLREGFKIILLGSPNVGKSSLLNQLTKRDTAIISDIPGTTRDIIEVSLNISGLPISLIDTAGLRNPKNIIEKEGIRRAIKMSENASLCLVIIDYKDWPNINKELQKFIHDSTIIIVNKIDNIENHQDFPKFLKYKNNIQIPIVALSALYGHGIENLLSIVTKNIQDKINFDGPLPITRLRYRTSLKKTCEYLSRALNNTIIELIAEDIRLAVREIGKITGRVQIDDLLNIIFKDF